MPHRPKFDEFAALARDHTVVPVYRQLTGDTLTPVSAFGKVREGDWSFLFESVVGGERIGRYSFLGAGPFRLFEAAGDRVRVKDGTGPWRESTHADPLKVLEDMVAEYRAPHVPGLPRFVGGAVGYAGYDAVRYVERLPNTPPDDRGIPDLSFGFYDRMVVFDHITKTIAAVAHAHVGRSPPTAVGGLRGAYDTACRHVDQLVERLQRGVADLQLTDIDVGHGQGQGHGQVERRYSSNFTRDQFEAAVRTAIGYINAGDVFQVVLSQRFQTGTKARPFDIY